MPAEAKINPAWLRQWLIIATLLAAFGAWSAYDANILYPAHNERAAAYALLQSRNRLDDWPALAAQHDWPTDPPAKPHSTFDTAWNQFVAISCLLALLLILTRIFILSRKSFRTDDAGLHTPGRPIIPYNAITQLDKSRWQSRGLATLSYRNPDAQPARLLLNAWVFKGTETLLKEIEQRTGLGDNA